MDDFDLPMSPDDVVAAKEEDTARFWELVQSTVNTPSSVTEVPDSGEYMEVSSSPFPQNEGLGMGTSTQIHAAMFVSAISKKAAQSAIEAQGVLEPSGTERAIVFGPCCGEENPSENREETVARRVRWWTWACLLMVLLGVTFAALWTVTAHMIAEESPDTARLRYTEALFFSNFTTCGDPNPTCCTDCVGNWCDGCESAWHVSLKCCPGNAETITADYKHVFWAALAVTILVSIAFLSVPWVLFFSTPPPGKWVPTSEAGFRTTSIARCRAFLLGDPVATRRVRVSHVSKERLGTLLGSRYVTYTDLRPEDVLDPTRGDRILVKVFERPSSLPAVLIFFSLISALALFVALFVNVDTSGEISCYDCSARSDWKDLEEHVGQNVQMIEILLLVDVGLLIMCWFIAYSIHPINFVGKTERARPDTMQVPLSPDVVLSRTTPSHPKRLIVRTESSPNIELRQPVFDDDDDNGDYLDVSGLAEGEFPGFGEATPTTMLRRKIARLEAHLPQEVDTRVDRLLGISGGVYSDPFGFDVDFEPNTTKDSALPAPARLPIHTEAPIPSSTEYLAPPTYVDDPVDAIKRHHQEEFTLAVYQYHRNHTIGCRSIEYTRPPAWVDDDDDEANEALLFAKVWEENVMRSRTYVQQQPPFFHGELSEEKACALLLENDGVGDEGKYLVRLPVGQSSHGQLVISVIAKGRPTHHIADFTNNDSGYSMYTHCTNCATIEALVEHLHETNSWWTTPLTSYVPVGGDYHDDERVSQERTIKPPAAEESPPPSQSDEIPQEIDSDQLQELPLERRRLGNTAHTIQNHIAYQGFLANDEVASFLMNSIQGQYCGAFMLWETLRHDSQAEAVVPIVAESSAAVIEETKPDPISLAKPKDTQPPWLHSAKTREEATKLIEQVGPLRNGRFLVHERPKQKGVFVISVVFKESVTHHLAKPREDGVYVVNRTSFADAKDIVSLVKILGKVQKGWPIALDKPVCRTVNDIHMPARTTFENNWMAAGIQDKEEASALLQEQAEGGGLVDGMFIAWARPEKIGAWVISVVFKGRVTHHGIKTSSDGELVLNRNRFGGHSTLESLVKQLGSVQPNWPIALDKPCAPSLETTREQKPEVPEPEVAPQVAPPIDSREGPSHHKEKKQMVLMSVRNKTGRIDTYEFVQRDEEFIVDGHTLPSCKSVNGALEYLAEKHEWWPTALAYAVGWPAHKTDASLTSMINTTIVLIENHFAGFGQVANPVISVSDDAASLHIECDTPGCHIYYTTDGSVPSADGSGSSTRYDPGLPLSVGGLFSVAKHITGLSPGPEIVSTFELTHSDVRSESPATLLQPTENSSKEVLLRPGRSASPRPVSLSDAPKAGSHLDSGSTPVPWALLNKGMLLQPLGQSDQQSVSTPLDDLQGQQMETALTQQSGQPEKTVDLEAVSSETGTDLPPQQGTGIVVVTAVARRQGLSDSSVVQFNLSLDRSEKPTFSYECLRKDGVAVGTQININRPNDTCTVYYTLDGTRPKPGFSAVYSEETRLEVAADTASRSLNVRAVCSEVLQLPSLDAATRVSATRCSRVQFATLDALELAMRGGLLGMNCSTEGANIYYRINGPTPLATVGGVDNHGNPQGIRVDCSEGITEYSNEAPPKLNLEKSVTRSATICAIAVKEGMYPSEPFQYKYQLPEGGLQKVLETQVQEVQRVVIAGLSNFIVGSTAADREGRTLSCEPQMFVKTLKECLTVFTFSRTTEAMRKYGDGADYILKLVKPESGGNVDVMVFLEEVNASGVLSGAGFASVGKTKWGKAKMKLGISGTPQNDGGFKAQPVDLESIIRHLAAAVASTRNVSRTDTGSAGVLKLARAHELTKGTAQNAATKSPEQLMAERKAKIDEQLRLTAEREAAAAEEARVTQTKRMTLEAMNRLDTLLLSELLEEALDDVELHKWHKLCLTKAKYSIKFNDKKDLYKFFLPLGPLSQYNFRVPGYGDPLLPGDPFPPPTGATKTGGLSGHGDSSTVAEVMHRFIVICDAVRASQAEPDVVLSGDQLLELRRAAYSAATTEVRVPMEGEAKILDLRRAINEVRLSDIGHTMKEAISELVVDWYAADDTVASGERTTRKTKIPAHDLVMAVWTQFVPQPEEAESATTFVVDEETATNIVDEAPPEVVDDLIQRTSSVSDAAAFSFPDFTNEQPVAEQPAPFEFPIFTDQKVEETESGEPDQPDPADNVGEHGHLSDIAATPQQPITTQISEDPEISENSLAHASSMVINTGESSGIPLGDEPTSSADVFQPTQAVEEDVYGQVIDLSSTSEAMEPPPPPPRRIRDEGGLIPDSSVGDEADADAEDDDLYEMPDRTLQPPSPPPRSEPKLDDSSDDDIYEAPILARPPPGETITITKQSGEKWGLIMTLVDGEFVLGKSPTPNTPADGTPLRKGTAILRVNGESTTSWTKKKFAEALKGKTELTLDYRNAPIAPAPAFH